MMKHLIGGLILIVALFLGGCQSGGAQLCNKLQRFSQLRACPLSAR